MASWVDVYGGVEGLDVDRLLDAPPDPITFTRQDGNVFLSEMVFIIARMLEHGGFEFALRIDGGGGVLLETSLSGALCFPHIGAWAWRVAGAGTRYVVDEAVGLFLFEFVLGFDEIFSKRPARRNGSGYTFGIESPCNGLCDTRVEGQADHA